MTVNSVSPLLNPYVVQPAQESSKTQQHSESVQGASTTSPAPQTSEKSDGEESAVVQNHYAAPSMSTQDMMVLKAQAHDDQFQSLDDAIARIKENADQMGDLVEALHKMSKAADKDNLALQVLTKTLEAIDEASGEK